MAANSRIRADLEAACQKAGARLWLPPLALCGDNAAMVAIAGYYKYLAGDFCPYDAAPYARVTL